MRQISTERLKGIPSRDSAALRKRVNQIIQQNEIKALWQRRSKYGRLIGPYTASCIHDTGHNYHPFESVPVLSGVERSILIKKEVVPDTAIDVILRIIRFGKGRKISCYRRKR